MDLEKLKLGIWKRMQDSLENVIKQIKEAYKNYKP